MQCQRLSEIETSVNGREVSLKLKYHKYYKHVITGIYSNQEEMQVGMDRAQDEFFFFFFFFFQTKDFTFMIERATKHLKEQMYCRTEHQNREGVGEGCWARNEHVPSVLSFFLSFFFIPSLLFPLTLFACFSPPFNWYLF
eukprot:TRINITY_DN5906_c0_g2_i1.p1 TRINITY_DN5906_c0_g2~~TRINITY_DN5906_c0_g2_i1.p1  ORF type:complete len:140 (-),score=13.53 TRINITY_DN5906_c0_g2_i1:506-925(-)